MIDDLYGIIGGKLTVWAATECFYRRVLEDESLRPFFASATWHTFALGRVCLFPCCSAGESCIRARISMMLMRMHESKGLTAGISIGLLITSVKPFLTWVSRLTR